MDSNAPGNAVRELYAALWRYAEGARPQLLTATALLTGSQLLRLTTPWRCAACSATSATWTARCGACGRWDTLRAASEDVGGSPPLASDSLIRPER